MQADDDYYTLQGAFSASDSRCGPMLDLCLELLLCEKRGDKFHSDLLEEFTSSDFYDYQIVGSVGMLLKLLGTIDGARLIAATKLNPRSVKAKRVSAAASKLWHRCIHGALLADGTGFGKTKQCLLTALLFSFLTEENKPALLVVPASLVYQWLDEIQTHWLSGLHPILSYGRTSVTNVEELSKWEMATLEFPDHLKYLLDQQDPKAKQAVILTSYETHKSRTLPEALQKETRSTRMKNLRNVKLPHSGKFGLLIADEAHKIKNKRTILWALLSMQDFSASIFATATPMFNAVRVSEFVAPSKSIS